MNSPQSLGAGPIITVTGSSRSTVAPELAQLTVEAQASGPQRADVVDRATKLAADIQQRFAALHGDAASPVQQWHSQSVHVWSERPWNEQGKQLPLVHHARIQVQATFRDFTALGAEAEALSAIDGVAVHGIWWRLTEATEADVQTEVQRGAIQNALTKAQNYAEALGYASVRTVAIADPGLLSDGSVDSGSMAKRGGLMAMAAPSPEADMHTGIELRPDELTFTAQVEARFLAQ